MAIPTAVFQYMFGLAKSPASWNIPMNVYAHCVRFAMANADWRTTRSINATLDLIERFRVWWSGFRVEHVKRHFHDQIVSGSWIVSKGDILPDVGSVEWNDRHVCFWAHGIFDLRRRWIWNWLGNDVCYCAL